MIPKRCDPILRVVVMSAFYEDNELLQGVIRCFKCNDFNHVMAEKCFYLRLLLVNVCGPTSSKSLQTVNGVLCPTYRDACQRLQLLENDTHWDMTLADAIMCATANQIRSMFAIIISTCNPSNPKDLWDKYKDDMSEDFFHRIRAAVVYFRNIRGEYFLSMCSEVLGKHFSFLYFWLLIVRDLKLLWQSVLRDIQRRNCS